MFFSRAQHWGLALALLWLCWCFRSSQGVILTPPYFNLAEGRRIHATATCGVDTEGPELYCKLVGANAENDEHVNLIQGQVCDYCDPSRPDKMHPPEFAADGMETWWQSPPLSRGMKYNEVNLTIDLGQEFHVAYVYVRMGNSPRPGLWVLEKSSDYGKTYKPWQYFSDSTADCETYFGKESLQPITKDNSVICTTEYSKIVPLEGGEIPISLLNNRPSANMYFNSSILQEWTRATNVRLRLLRTKNLLGHLMSVARQDPTVTRRYFYSIKDISIGGRCMCNGHADTCDIQDPEDPKKLLCRCQHNTCGPQCAACCPGFEQKAWRISKAYKKFECEPCNCFNHSTECKYEKEVDEQGLSLDIHGRYEGGGICQNCQDNTEGINCNKCKPTFYRPHGKQWNDIDVCQPCECDAHFSTGNCAEGSGQCECRPEFTPPLCDACSFGYFDYPNCKPCECDLNGTIGYHCEAQGGQCPCKDNYAGRFCKQCADTFYNFPECLACECNTNGSLTQTCNQESGYCACRSNYRERTCDECEHGYYNYPNCAYCNCDVSGTLPSICNKTSGACLCRDGFSGPRCDQCAPGYYGYPSCRPCGCSNAGSPSQLCDVTGKCPCLPSFAGRTCDQCSPGHYKYPECLACNCDTTGAIGMSCDSEGTCTCQHNFDGNRCDMCKEGFYNYPNCEDCNCNPSGVSTAFAGCGSVPAGELCECKSRVHGRICDQCRPLYWNLQLANPDGCEPCDCHLPGTLGGLAVCDSNSGQCMCKKRTAGQRCQECADGTWMLREEDLFGCEDCDCDIGGSISPVCDKQSGQCACQARINGRTCRDPLTAHYFPTLYQYLYEVEDSRTLESQHVRYGFDERDFNQFSWKGYAVFSPLQNEIIRDVYIEKPSLYRMVLRYVNPNPEPVNGVVVIQPDSSHDIEQKFSVQFKPAREPTFVTVAGPQGTIPSPLVMNPGRWAVSIRSTKRLLLDYFVLLPQAYYEATILTQHVKTPCTIGSEGLCRHFAYPNISQFDAAHGDGGFIQQSEGFKESLTDLYTEEEQLSELGVGMLAVLGKVHNEFSVNLTVTKPGRYVLLVTYATPLQTASEEDSTRSQMVSIEHNESKRKHNLKVTLNPCPYTTLCRQVVTDQEGRIANLHFDTNYNTITLRGNENSNIGINSIVAIPHSAWSFDYIRPKSVCVRKDGKCVPAQWPPAPQSKKVRFEIGNEEQVAKIRPPHIHDNASNLIYLDHKEAMVDVKSKVPTPGYYVFVVHFYQPNHPEFDMNVLIQNGQFYEAELPVRHCPSNSGCRAIIAQEDGNIRFSLNENFVLSLKEPNHKSVWLEHLLVVPAELYTDHLLTEENFDHTGEFISTCGNNHFHINASVDGFCRDSVFSLTADYNNGALPCDCDFSGSLSFECEKFGGQCQCKPNVIGRKCDLCRTGYYGFPDCRPCNCPSTTTCQPETGQCICPQRVTGEKCDQCIPLTFGFDQIIGCEDCNCNPLGVQRAMQCDLFNGSCTCKPNIVGRTCDHCLAGFHSFPYCEPCRCDLRGTTLDICGQQYGECHCKEHVQGPECDFCAEGTFNLQANNEQGCTKCFCFGKTTRCSSSLLYRTQIGGMANWTLVEIVKSQEVEVIPSEDMVHPLNSSSISIDLYSDEEPSDEFEIAHYFSAPESYLGNRLTSYGGWLNYSLLYTIPNTGGPILGADVILKGGETYLLHYALEQPPSDYDYYFGVELVESNFVLPNDRPARREDLMTVLENLKGVFVRAGYWTPGGVTKLSEVSLDVAQRDYIPAAPLALSVEQCQCPPNYSGLSCSECAPGYWRSAPGYCAPCQCHGHANSCDVNTGRCDDCKHNTTGEHCEMCAVGYHGNALQGTPMDCLICACPLPIEGNNFATGCEMSANGEEISCDCLPGYYGARCESCAAGFFGLPELPGHICEPCSCSGNINPEEPGSCDSTTGQCLRCLNNTFGEACALCAPGYYGDAIIQKDCQHCDCDPLGTEHCDSYSGRCECLENVIGEKCDSCRENHYGYTSGVGCRPCSCDEASESSQCDDATGQCRCRSGVTGRQCERCAPGFWNYTPQGCVSCGCNTEYSLGFGCNARTGQCECLPGVIGEKCDHCPYRWVLILNQGCYECDKCTHNLLDTTDYLRNLIDPVIADFEAVASGFFTSRRLIYINNTLNELTPLVQDLSLNETDILGPILRRLEPSESESKNLNRRANFSSDTATNVAPDANELRKQALDVLNVIRLAAINVNNTVYEIGTINFDTGEDKKIDQALLEADLILQEIRRHNLSGHENDALAQLEKAKEVLENVKQYQVPVDEQTKEWKRMKFEVKSFKNKLEDLANITATANGKLDETDDLLDKYRGPIVYDKVSSIESTLEDSETDLSISADYLRNATRLLRQVNRTGAELREGIEEFDELTSEFNNTIISLEENEELDELVEQAENHATNLSKQAELLDHLLSDTRNISGDAVGAANAYRNIVNATESAQRAAEDAYDAAQKASELLDGLEDRSNASAQTANKLLTEANDALHKAQVILQPQLKDAAEEIDRIEKLSNRSETEYKKIVDGLGRLGNQNLADLADYIIGVSENADTKAQKALESVSNIGDNIKNDLRNAQELLKDTEDTKRDILQAETQLNTVNKVLPNITNLIDDLGPQQSQLQNTMSDIEDKIKRLNHQINIARELANRVGVARRFAPNTTLELKKPPNLQDLATSNHISMYFRTDNPNGLLLYLGNPNGTKLPKTDTDDYLSLEIQNGYPVLNFEIGNGRQYIINEKYVADNQTYQAVVDRTGPNIKFTIKEEQEGGVVNHEKESIMEDYHTIFNLDPEQSRLFVGGYPASVNVQKDVRNSLFEGDIEDVVINNQKIGLWNFVDGENHYGGVQRNKLVNVDSNTGYRFNGNGYAILNARSHHLSTRTEVRFIFKTTAYTGLMFLVGDENTGQFMSIEMRDGQIWFQYNLGDGLVSIRSSNTYADGGWHAVKASRDGQNGLLEVDHDKWSGKSSGQSKSIAAPDLMFWGGYPLQHRFAEVTNVDFDGCIDDVQIRGTPVNLRLNLKAFGVASGCPDKYATLVSFQSPGHIRHPNVSSSNAFKLFLKFKTQEPNGLIFYATDRDQTAGISLGLVNGALLLNSQRQELTTPDTYNDNKWHVVTVVHNMSEFRVDVDDNESKSLASDASGIPLMFMYGNMYIGGLPTNYVAKKGAVATTAPFIGCVGDAALNGYIVNLANSTDRSHDILGRCILDRAFDGDYDYLHAIPKLDKESSKPWEEGPTTTEEPFVLKPDKPSRGDGGDDDDRNLSSFTEAEYHAPTTTVRPLFEHEPQPQTLPPPVLLPEENELFTQPPPYQPTPVSEFDEPDTEAPFIAQTEPPIIAQTEPPFIPQTIAPFIPQTEPPFEPVTEPTTTTTEVPTAATTTQRTTVITRKPGVGDLDSHCALPMIGLREGVGQYGYKLSGDSRVEFAQTRGRYKNQYNFSIEFRTTQKEGLIFYVSDKEENLHFVALYLIDGKLQYTFSCGGSPADLPPSDLAYNDGEWHTVVWSRNQAEGSLMVDNVLVARGRLDPASHKQLNIHPPYYLGSVEHAKVVAISNVLKSYAPFSGCLRNFLMNNKPMQDPSLHRVIPCDDRPTEPGVYFMTSGFAKLKDSFVVGVEIDIQMDIKPRNITGLLMSVHGKRDYLVLQMVDGTIKLSVNNGKGPIEAAFKPPSKHYFCDGQWHSIQAIKSKNVASLSVDRTFADAGVGEQHSTDTRFGLFLGGHQVFAQGKRIRGVHNPLGFSGCIRDVKINNEPVKITRNMVQGDAIYGGCPVN